jgi:hypothetical protein
MTHTEFIAWLEGFLESDQIVDSGVKTKIFEKIRQIKASETDFSKVPEPYETPYTTSKKVPYHKICSCNPKNGGSGICGCIQGNKLVDPIQKTNFSTSSSATSELDRLLDLHEKLNTDKLN